MNFIDLIRFKAEYRSFLRSFFTKLDYIEIDTPIMVSAPGTEQHLDYFKTHWIDHGLKAHPYFLRSSPEIHMKRALSHGAERIFQLAKCFRNNGELSDWHEPEFTMLEWYQNGISYSDYMQQTEDLIRESFVWAKTQKKLSPHKLKFPFTRLTLAEAFKEFAKIDLIDQDPELWNKARKQGIISVNEGEDFETSFFKILIDRIEPKLEELGSSVLYDYPASQAALAQVENGVAKRFEFYIGRVELSNGFQELLEPQINRLRIEESLKARQAMGKEADFDYSSFLRDLERGLEPCCGNALGFDRLFALLLGSDTIAKGLEFPLEV